GRSAAAQRWRAATGAGHARGVARTAHGHPVRRRAGRPHTHRCGGLLGRHADAAAAPGAAAAAVPAWLAAGYHRKRRPAGVAAAQKRIRVAVPQAAGQRFARSAEALASYAGDRPVYLLTDDGQLVPPNGRPDRSQSTRDRGYTSRERDPRVRDWDDEPRHEPRYEP